MDFFNKALAQLQDLFRSMTPGARITAGLLLAVVVTSLVYLFRYQVSGPDTYLMNGEPVAASHLRVMEGAFAKANLNSYQIDGARVRVPRGQQAAYMAALADGKALPPNFGSAFRDAIAAGSPFESERQRQHRIKIALQDELALIIGSMKGIESAYVLYDTETKGGLSREKAATATVGVKPLGNEPIEESRVSSIRHLVAGAISSLKPENVTVADLNGSHVYHGDPDNSGIASENLYVAVTQMHERALKKKILDALSYIPNLTVEPSVVLDHDKFTRSVLVEHKPKPVAVRVEEKTSSSSREGAGSGGRPGLEAQGNKPLALAAATSKGTREEQEDSQRREENVVSGERSEKESVGLTPKSAKVSVGIPSSYFEKVWRERNPVKEGDEPKTPDQTALDQIRTEESTKIQKHVANLLPAADGVKEPADLVTITTFQDLKPGDIPQPAVSQQALAWFGRHWSTLGLAGLALVSLAMLRSMVRGGRPSAPQTESMQLRIAASEAASEEIESEDKKVARKLRRFTGSGPSLRDELSELVNEDPDAAANILRAWIGQAG